MALCSPDSDRQKDEQANLTGSIQARGSKFRCPELPSRRKFGPGSHRVGQEEQVTMGERGHRAGVSPRERLSKTPASRQGPNPPERGTGSQAAGKAPELPTWPASFEEVGTFAGDTRGFVTDGRGNYVRPRASRSILPMLAGSGPVSPLSRRLTMVTAASLAGVGTPLSRPLRATRPLM